MIFEMSRPIYSFRDRSLVRTIKGTEINMI